MTTTTFPASDAPVLRQSSRERAVPAALRAFAPAWDAIGLSISSSGTVAVMQSWSEVGEAQTARAPKGSGPTRAVRMYSGETI
mgnify:FL=1